MSLREGKKVWEMREGMFAFNCPACRYCHAFYTKDGPRNDAGVEQLWTFNGDLDRPTVRPSLNVNSKDPASRCHSWVTDGKIQFLGDCFHDMKNQTVEIPDDD